MCDGAISLQRAVFDTVPRRLRPALKQFSDSGFPPVQEDKERREKTVSSRCIKPMAGSKKFRHHLRVAREEAMLGCDLYISVVESETSKPLSSIWRSHG